MKLPGPLPLRTDWSLTRGSEFSYECRGCSRCCHGKAIPVNPYEIARLAEVLGTTTTAVLTDCTTNGGAILSTRADGACVFLGERGCTPVMAESATLHGLAVTTFRSLQTRD